jgi:hypothetical protein
MMRMTAVCDHPAKHELMCVRSNGLWAEDIDLDMRPIIAGVLKDA